ncbi:hypothetical protein BRADI_1g15065v3 [Brachypodium distachyon]|uniref:Uncharacterized protein n=1 Tax=Brachypodium distachyon TaxID=15368 RepID=A0A0Q3GTP7_BRADI|nr:hypothetical protein BRADI_1g15065v3 [Brachypodium distachyon]
MRVICLLLFDQEQDDYREVTGEEGVASMLGSYVVRNSRVHAQKPELIDKMGYVVKLVWINKRIQEAYCVVLYLAKIGDQADGITFDLRPSYAINIAFRCKRSSFILSGTLFCITPTRVWDRLYVDSAKAEEYWTIGTQLPCSNVQLPHRVAPEPVKGSDNPGSGVQPHPPGGDMAAP